MRSHCLRQRRCYNHDLSGCNRLRHARGRCAIARPLRSVDPAVSSRSWLWHLAA